jgi:type I restriction-modification system DNA methylase subunit
MNIKIVNRLKVIYSKYLWKVSLEDYLEQSRQSKIWDEEKVTDSLFEMLIKDKDLWNYSKDNVLLQQQQHKANIDWKISNLKPDFETNNEFCKTPILFDAKASNIPYGEMVSWTKTVYDYTFKRYLENIKPYSKYIIWFNLEYIILYWRDSNQKIQVLAAIDVKKLFNNDIKELTRFEKFLDLTKFEELNNEEKIEKLANKVLDEDSIFNIEIFVKKFKNTQNWLYNFFLERLEQIGIDDIPDEIKDELEEFIYKPKDFYIQLANRLTLIEFFKYIFIRTYEDFQLIHKIDDKVIPVTFWEAIKNIKYEEWNLDDFRDKYIRSINRTSFKDIWEEFFQGFSSLFRKYEFFIEEHILEWDSDEEEFDKEYHNRLFDIIFFLNEFYFGWLEAEWDDIIGRLYETSLERADRKRFGQFYTPRYIIDFILDELKIEPGKDKRIVDLSCWTGGFLMKYLSKIDWKILIDEDETLLKDIFKGTYWIDIKMFSTLLTKLNLALIFIIKNKFLIKKKLKTHKLETKNIITWDWLEINKPEDKKLEKWTFDYVVWNPPYVWIKWNADIVSRVKWDWLMNEYFTKRSDLYYFFIIHWIEKLKVWWKFGYIFPREWITADFANKLREYILKNTKVLKLIDLNGISIFEDAWTTSCLLFLEKVENKVENNNFDYIQFKDFEKQNIIKYINENSEDLQTKTTETKKQKVLSWFEIFSKLIMVPDNFDKIVKLIKKWDKFDISRLWGLTTWKINLADFIEIKEINQIKLSDKPWLFWTELPQNANIVSLDSILNISQWIVTWADSITKKHFENWLVKEYEIWRWIFILKEELEIRWIWLKDIRNKKDTIWKIEINLYENWWWIELNEDDKKWIKSLYWLQSLNKWWLNKNSKFIIYLTKNELEEYNLLTIKNHFNLYKGILLNRTTKDWSPRVEDNWNIKWNWDLMRDYCARIPFEKEKILSNTKVLGFTFTEKSAYWNGWWLGGLNYIFIDNKNKYTKIIEEKSSRKDYLKFINAILNSSTIINYIKDNKFNSLSWTKLKELKIPKINFNDEEQVKRYNRVVELADELIKIYSDKDSLICDLVIKKEWSEIVENGSLEFNEIMKSKNFEIEDDILFSIKVWWVEYFWFDNLKTILKSWKEENKNIWEILGLDDWKNTDEIKKINSEIDELSKWFYYENDSVPDDYVEDKQGRLV